MPRPKVLKLEIDQMRFRRSQQLGYAVSLADIAEFCAVSRQTIFNYRSRNFKSPNWMTIMRMCAYLNCTPEELIANHAEWKAEIEAARKSIPHIAVPAL